MARRWFRNHILFIAFLIFVVGWYMSITGGYWAIQQGNMIGKDYRMEYLTAWAGAWNYWILGIGIILIFIGGWYVYDIFRKRRKFEEYMETESKKKFKENLRDLEEIAYKLGDWYVERLEEKKREWRIK